jgi:AcrR family transcriptional regulator
LLDTRTFVHKIMVMVQTARHEKIKAEILLAAARVIAKHGFHGMSMRKLARATKKGLATYYNYFASKEEVLFDLQRQAFTTLIRAAGEALASVDDPADRLRGFISSHIRYFMAHPDIMQILVHEAATLPPKWRKEIRVLKEQYFRIGREVVRQVLNHYHGGENDEPEIERAAYGIFGMLNWVYGWYEPSRHGTSEDVTRTLHRVSLIGLKGDSSS